MQRGKIHLPSYKLSIFFFVDRLFLIVSNGVLRRNRHDIYAQTYTNKQ
jgi:hypothetical protein